MENNDTTFPQVGDIFEWRVSGIGARKARHGIRYLCLEVHRFGAGVEIQVLELGGIPHKGYFDEYESDVRAHYHLVSRLDSNPEGAIVNP